MSIDLERKEKWTKATKEEENRIREMKKSRDYHKWASLSHEIDKKFWELTDLKEKEQQLVWISNEVSKKFSEMVELKHMERQLEDKLMNKFNIKIYTKYGLFRSRRYDNIR